MLLATTLLFWTMEMEALTVAILNEENLHRARFLQLISLDSVATHNMMVGRDGEAVARLRKQMNARGDDEDDDDITFVVDVE